MKSGIFRWLPRKKVDRSYKNFDLKHFKIELKSELKKLNDSSCNEFETAFYSVMNKHAPVQTQRNYCVSLLKKAKQQYFQNLNLNDITDNKIFWQTIKPYFNEQGSDSDKIALSGNDSVLTIEKRNC